MAPKSKFVAFRAEPEQHRKLLRVAQKIGIRGNASAALRWLVDNSDNLQPHMDIERKREVLRV